LQMRIVHEESLAIWATRVTKGNYLPNAAAPPSLRPIGKSDEQRFATVLIGPRKSYATDY
jgi:hypothetical protein